MRDCQLFFPEVRHGGMVVNFPEDIPPPCLGERLRRRCREIVDRPYRAAWKPPGICCSDASWNEVRHHHVVAFGTASIPRRPDERHVVALAHGVGEVVAEGLLAPVFDGLNEIERIIGKVAALSQPANRDPWAPKERMTS